MDHGDEMDGELSAEVGGDLLHFGQGHGFVSLILEVKGAAILGMVTNEAVEDDYGAVAVAANMSCQGLGVYRLVNQSSDIGEGGVHECSSATAYGREEGDFIARVKNGVPGRELLIAGGDQRGAILLKLGMPAGILGK